MMVRTLALLRAFVLIVLATAVGWPQVARAAVMPLIGGGIFNTIQPSVSDSATVMSQATSRGALIVGTGVEPFPVRQGDPGRLSGAWPQMLTDGLRGPVAVTGPFMPASSLDPALVVTISPNSVILRGLLLMQGSITGEQSGPLVQGAVTTAGPTYTAGQTSPLSLDTSGNLRVNAVESGTWTVQPGNTANTTAWLVTGTGGTFPISGNLAGNQAINVAQINTVTPLMGNGPTGAGSQRVTVASDNTAFSVNAVQSGTWIVQPGNTANTTAWLTTGTGGVFPATQSGTWTVQPGNTANTTAWLTTTAGNAAVLAGQQAVTATAAALATNTVKNICVKALTANTINVYIGPSTVTTANGHELAPGDGWCGPVTNTNLLFVIAATTGASVSWVSTN